MLTCGTGGIKENDEQPEETREIKDEANRAIRAKPEETALLVRNLKKVSNYTTWCIGV